MSIIKFCLNDMVDKYIKIGRQLYIESDFCAQNCDVDASTLSMTGRYRRTKLHRKTAELFLTYVSL